MYFDSNFKIKKLNNLINKKIISNLKKGLYNSKIKNKTLM